MIFPAIDLMDGGCVRLFKGDFNQRTDYELSPVEMATKFADAGAEWIHVVDLDGAQSGRAEQAPLIIEIAQQTGLKIQTGGGIRELSQIQTLLNGGVERVVIGSLAISNPEMIKYWMSELGPERIVLALDVMIGDDGVPRPAIRGWTEESDKTLWHVIESYLPSGLKNILVTDIARDGVLEGSNVELYKKIRKKHPKLDLITSGGVGSLKDVKALKKIKPAGIIIGKALYEGKFDVKQAIAC
ncbi:MAG: 1-(5-phosphoribosyl)-5-[(5-phosphoribosylamino)methylideneamino]imidazole-4-carboxamide isomerase [Acidimicrobiales bacterium]|nr:1-(5-phosphoribosyl)-5-[(5-phosphoribosylamino)methylideneamino]imidazole-4-carboxamide isomerase [Hyphomonadaceae bacterium]RZV37565.1 MAG: 1-(5-phosphoribosyl)-5-[(5-phosphoribosylamino)methylideneamino]imidazole-4-carboxamide isomerase [Acidimicrobiales bacterium]